MLINSVKHSHPSLLAYAVLRTEETVIIKCCGLIQLVIEYQQNIKAFQLSLSLGIQQLITNYFPQGSCAILLFLPFLLQTQIGQGYSNQVLNISGGNKHEKLLIGDSLN